MEGERGRFGAGVIDVACVHEEAGETGNRHNVPVVSPDPVGMEFPDEQEMRDDVHVERAPDLLFRLLEDGLAGPDAGVIDENCGLADLFADLSRDGVDVHG